MTFQPELLSPAGTLKNMRYALAYGADAVYAGQPRYSLRVRNNEFTHDNLQLGINEVHKQGKKFYVVCNIQPHNAKLKTFITDMQPIIAMQPDALIMSDPGLIMMVRDSFPDMVIHLSVQANAVNWASVQFWHRMGVQRVILSRELSLEEIEDIRHHVPEMELEVFVHGALCMAYSGRCLLSGYINKRDPNQGTCTNACRWEYKVHPATENEVGQIVSSKLETLAAPAAIGVAQPSKEAVLLEEPGRPGELMPVYEDEHGTYIMNSRDLRAIRHVERLAAMGVTSLKIEGRTKSFYYCARTAQLYRRAIDDAAAGKAFDVSLETTLESLAHRGYTEGFLRRHISHSETQNYDYGYSISERQQFVGEFTGNYKGDLAEVDVKNKFLTGDQVELMTPEGNVNFTLEHIENAGGERIESGKGSGHIVYIPIPENINLTKALLMRNLPKNSNTRQSPKSATTPAQAPTENSVKSTKQIQTPQPTNNLASNLMAQSSIG